MTDKNLPILLIQRDAAQRNALSSRLRTQGHKVENATNALHALHLIENKHFGLIIISTIIEHMSCYECIMLIRQSFSKAQLPILTLVAPKTKQEELVEILSAGSNECVVQSNNVAILMKKITELLKTDNS